MLTIAWDVDDCLNDLMTDWFEKEWLVKHPDCRLKSAGLKANPPHQILGITLDEYLESVDFFRLSGKYQELEPVREIRDWFKERGFKYRHIALTATPVKAAANSASWVFHNFGNWIRTFHFVPSKREGEDLTQYDKNKAEYLTWLNKVDIFIDDSEENIKGAGGLRIKGILFPRPWNNAKGTISEVLSLL